MDIVKPNRATRTYTRRLVGSPEAVFPLLCPVRERDWIQGLDPVLVVSKSGVAKPDCVFTTGAEPSDAISYSTHSHTSLGPEGDKFVAAFTEEYCMKFMQDWEVRMNYFLTNHNVLVAGA